MNLKISAECFRLNNNNYVEVAKTIINYRSAKEAGEGKLGREEVYINKRLYFWDFFSNKWRPAFMHRVFIGSKFVRMAKKQDKGIVLP